jgi:hypothetical protein
LGIEETRERLPASEEVEGGGRRGKDLGELRWRPISPAFGAHIEIFPPIKIFRHFSRKNFLNQFYLIHCLRKRCYFLNQKPFKNAK